VAQTSAAALAGAAIGLIDLEKRFDNVGAVRLSLDIAPAGALRCLRADPAPR
jgi:hypothetical protein